MKCHTMEEFKNYLNDAETARVNPVMFKDIDEMCAPMFDDLDIDEDSRNLLNELAQKDDGEEYCINANVVLKQFGVVAEGQDATKIRRLLERTNLLKPNAEKVKNIGIIEKNKHCKVNRKKVAKNGQSYYTTTYYITKDALYKALMRCYNDDKYADYFSLQWRISEMLKTHQANHALAKAEIEHDTFKSDILKALGVLQANHEIDRANHKLTHAKLDGNRNICRDIVKRTKDMKESLDKVQDFMTQTNAKATLDPVDQSLHHGYAITRKDFRKSGVSHFNIIAGQRKYVEKTISEHIHGRGRTLFVDFTYIANPIDYRHNLRRVISERIDTIVIETNTQLIEEKAAEDILRRDRITANTKEQTDARTEHANAVDTWTNPMRHIKTLNRKVSSDTAAFNQQLKDEIRAHNISVGNRRGHTRNFNNEKRLVGDYKLITADDVRRYLGYDEEEPPSLERFISFERIRELNEENSKLEFEIVCSAQEITPEDIPIRSSPLACTWKENPYWSYDDFVATFEQVRLDTQEVSCDVDMSIFDMSDLIEKMNLEEDDLLESSDEEDENVGEENEDYESMDDDESDFEDIDEDFESADEDA